MDEQRLLRDQLTGNLVGTLEKDRFGIPCEDIMRHFELLRHLGVENIDPRSSINIDDIGFGGSASERLKLTK